MYSINNKEENVIQTPILDITKKFDLEIEPFDLGSFQNQFGYLDIFEKKGELKIKVFEK